MGKIIVRPASLVKQGDLTLYATSLKVSDNLFNRFQQHLDSPDKTNPTEDGKAVWFYFTIYDPNNLPKLERTWLNQFACKHGRRPILNMVDSPVG